MSEKLVFAYTLTPPRPTFATDMTEHEASVMAEHAGYWTTLRDQGTAVAFGPVLDPAGHWGLAVVEAGSDAEIDRIRAGDPAVVAGIGTVAVHPMPGAIVRLPHTA
ncbi:hypothetical protein H7X46_02040 [Pseudonocardia sp. C8]|uniref:YciI family protein n=1 Tax=Pseudonocardia sp. C8 TaxID=2762759 RepID=UPI0016427A7D|nr:YciI family protein [Pseudonocardia sp. C8]MBC3189844.1 hypothetical protein [Pseudonocardia sp. C8]